MDYTPLSSFRRPISLVPTPASGKGTPVSKWEILRELALAKARFGLGARELGVLQALISFHPGDLLDPSTPLVVFPSNRSLAERLNGMPESTLRRHLARLVSAGVILRRDSPNGKRYGNRGNGAYGFDLSPLPARATEILTAATEARAEAEAVQRLRQQVSLMRRDLVAVATFTGAAVPGAEALCTAAQGLRRLGLAALRALAEGLSEALEAARLALAGPELSGSDAEIERHHQSSKEEYVDSEPRKEESRLPLQVVTSACPTLAQFEGGPIRHWHQLVAAVDRIRPGLGITSRLWDEARQVLGLEQASVVVAAMLERFGEIRCPGAYLRSLTRKAESGAFTAGPMIMALLGRAA